jgi:hypothetical protein
MAKLRNGHSKAYLLYSVPLMDEDEGARMRLSLHRLWHGTRGEGSRPMLLPLLALHLLLPPMPAEEMHDACTNLSKLECQAALPQVFSRLLCLWVSSLVL